MLDGAGAKPLLIGKADDGIRTHDPWLGKPMLYQLSYVRVRRILPSPEARLDAG